MEIEEVELLSLRCSAKRYEQLRHAVCTEDPIFINTMQGVIERIGEGELTEAEFNFAVDAGVDASEVAKQAAL